MVIHHYFQKEFVKGFSMKQMTGNTFSAGLIVVGNEILNGRTQDSNTPWIAARMAEYGIVLAESRIVPDSAEVVSSAINDMRNRFDYVFTTGGIGPTHDDITASSMADAFGVELELNDEAAKILAVRYDVRDLPGPLAKMATMPKGATMIPNPVTAAPGFIVENVHVMAGEPRIMQPMMDYVLKTIKVGDPILSNTVACTLLENVLAQDMEELQRNYPTVEIGSYPHYRGGVMGLNLVLRSTENDVLDRATHDLIDIIRSHGDEPSALSIKSQGQVSTVD
jgi:molybdenum cofactor synthesis domain-containing protein